jgi:hypothetical protein
MRIVAGAITGAAVGAGVAILMISLVEIRPFSVPANGFVERATFWLCPLFVLGFSKYVKSMTSLYVLTVAGNALIYAALSALIILGITLFRKFVAHTT